MAKMKNEEDDGDPIGKSLLCLIIPQLRRGCNLKLVNIKNRGRQTYISFFSTAIQNVNFLFVNLIVYFYACYLFAFLRDGYRRSGNDSLSRKSKFDKTWFDHIWVCFRVIA